MSGFRTKNSTYYIDSARRIVTGGFLGNEECVYTNAVAIIGSRAQISLADGREIITSTVLSYI